MVCADGMLRAMFFLSKSTPRVIALVELSGVRAATPREPMCPLPVVGLRLILLNDAKRSRNLATASCETECQHAHLHFDALCIRRGRSSASLYSCSV